MHELSGGATAVWDGCRRRRFGDLVDRLAADHETVADQIVGQVEDCLETLLRLGIVEEVPDSDG